MFVLNGEPFALTEPPGPGPAVGELHDIPLFEPGWPLVIVTVCGLAESAAPAEVNNKTAPMLDAMTCFIAILLFQDKVAQRRWCYVGALTLRAALNA